MDLRSYLDSRNIEHQEFAKMIGITSVSISNYLAGRRRPNLEIAARIEKATKGKVAISDLMKNWEEKNKSSHLKKQEHKKTKKNGER